MRHISTELSGWQRWLEGPESAGCCQLVTSPFKCSQTAVCQDFWSRWLFRLSVFQKWGLKCCCFVSKLCRWKLICFFSLFCFTFLKLSAVLVVLQVLAHCVCGSLLHQYGKTNNLRVVFAPWLVLLLNRNALNTGLLFFGYLRLLNKNFINARRCIILCNTVIFFSRIHKSLHLLFNQMIKTITPR